MPQAATHTSIVPNPIDIFKDIWRQAKREGALKHRNAVCVSTVDADGYPSARFVDLKEAQDTGFVFCTHLDSSKAHDIARNPKAAITLWWEHVATQIRIKGLCEPLLPQEADAHWASRLRDAQIATITFSQSRPLDSLESLEDTCARAVADVGDADIPRPDDWGGFRLRPEHIEFLEFQENRLHRRTAYALLDGQWHQRFLQP